VNRSADTKPLRLQLSRRSGFDLQKVSRDRNGLPAQSVARPSKWSNPFKVAEHGRERAMALYRAHLTNALATGALDISELRGRNLACWCKLDEACHADILLEQIAHSDD
jgi:Domain of unknown function (DUF4326)